MSNIQKLCDLINNSGHAREIMKFLEALADEINEGGCVRGGEQREIQFDD